jgi:hypothetical protein
MAESYQKEREYFDGRSWARDVTPSYDDLEKTKWFDKEYYDKHGIYDKDYEEFTQKFPLFTGKDFMVNQILPQLRGRPINKEGLDKHSDADGKITIENIERFLKED